MIVAADRMLGEQYFTDMSAGIREDRKHPARITSDYGIALKDKVEEIKKLPAIPEFKLSLNVEKKKECEALIAMNIKKKNIEGFSKEVTGISFIGATDQALTSSGDSTEVFPSCSM